MTRTVLHCNTSFLEFVCRKIRRRQVGRQCNGVEKEQTDPGDVKWGESTKVEILLDMEKGTVVPSLNSKVQTHSPPPLIIFWNSATFCCSPDSCSPPWPGMLLTSGPLGAPACPLMLP